MGKKPWKSRGAIGAALVIVIETAAEIARQSGLMIPGSTVPVAVVLAGILSLIGRWKAREPLNLRGR